MITSLAWLGSGKGSSVIRFEFDSVKLIAFYVAQRSSALKFGFDSDCFTQKNLELFHGHFSLVVMFQILAFYLDLRCYEHPCPLRHDLGLRRMLEVPDCNL